jgi:hypothetical protein
MDTNKHESMFTRLWRAEFCSPKDFARRAVLISIMFLAVHVAGLKEFTSMLNGTTGSVELSWGLSAFLGLMYILGWLAFVILVPILLLAAAMLVIWSRFSRGVLPFESSSRREEALTSVSNK